MTIVFLSKERSQFLNTVAIYLNRKCYLTISKFGNLIQ